MGQKINPLGFRLGTTQSHHSIWFAKPKNYAKELQKDEYIRYYIKNYIQKNMIRSVFDLIRVEIAEEVDVRIIKIHIVAGGPKDFKHYAEEGKNLQPNLEKKFAKKFAKKFVQKFAYVNPKQPFEHDGKTFKLNNKTFKLSYIYISPKFNFRLIRTKEPYQHANILAKFISAQLLEKIPVRKAMKKAIELAEKAKTNGIRVQIAGRIGGKEIARVEWIRHGRVPLQTIQAKIDYCSYPIRTIYGILGIKIWIFIDENPKRLPDIRL